MNRPKLDPTKDLREPVALAKWPFLALGPGRTSAFEFDRWGGKERLWIKATSDDPSGRATLADGDVVIWLTSVLAAAMNAGREMPTFIDYKPGDVLRALGRDTGGRRRELPHASLHRLAATRIATTIDTGGTNTGFSFVEDIQPGVGANGPSRLSIPQWLHLQVEEKRIIKVQPDDLRLTGLRRRLHGWARAHLQRERGDWSISFHDAYRKSGASGPPRKFMFELRGLIAADDLPDFCLSTRRDGSYDQVVFHHRSAGDKPAEAVMSDLKPDASLVEASTLILKGFEDWVEPVRSTKLLEIDLGDSSSLTPPLMSSSTSAKPSPSLLPRSRREPRVDEFSRALVEAHWAKWGKTENP